MVRRKEKKRRIPFSLALELKIKYIINNGRIEMRVPFLHCLYCIFGTGHKRISNFEIMSGPIYYIDFTLPSFLHLSWKICTYLTI